MRNLDVLAAGEPLPPSRCNCSPRPDRISFISFHFGTYPDDVTDHDLQELTEERARLESIGCHALSREAP